MHQFKSVHSCIKPRTMRMAFSAALLGVLAGLAGCAHDSNPQAKTSPGLNLAPGDPFGAIVGSIGHEASSPYAASHIVFRRTGLAGGGILIFQPKYMSAASPKDFESSIESGTVAVAKLPPGNYQIVSVGAMWNSGMTRFDPKLTLAEPIPFTVKQGRITYLGRYVLGNSGVRPTATPFVRIANSAAVDMRVATQRNPDLLSLAPDAFEVPSGRRDK